MGIDCGLIGRSFVILLSAKSCVFSRAQSNSDSAQTTVNRHRWNSCRGPFDKAGSTSPINQPCSGTGGSPVRVRAEGWPKCPLNDVLRVGRIVAPYIMDLAMSRSGVYSLCADVLIGWLPPTRRIGPQMLSGSPCLRRAMNLRARRGVAVDTLFTTSAVARTRSATAWRRFLWLPGHVQPRARQE